AREIGRGGADRKRRAHTPLCIVFVQEGEAEDGEHAIADELLDRAAVPFDNRAGGTVIRAKYVADVFWVERGAGGRRTDDIAEKHAEDFPRQSRRSRRHNPLRRPGERAIRELALRLSAAARADSH